MDSQADFFELVAGCGRGEAQQLQLVAAGLLPACRLRIRRERLPLMAELASRLSIKMIVGFDAIVMREDMGQCGFGQKAWRQPLSPHENADCYVYFCTDHIYGQKLRRADEAGDYCEAGGLLGHPSCCAHALSDHRRNVEELDPVLRNYDDQLPISWHLNVSLLCFDYYLLPYVPCTANCEPSMGLARKYHDFVSDVRPALASELKQALSTWVLHTDALGVAAFTAREKYGALEIDNIVAVDSQSVLGHLMNTGTVIGRDQHGITVDESLFAGSRIKLFHFV